MNEHAILLRSECSNIRKISIPNYKKQLTEGLGSGIGAMSGGSGGNTLSKPDFFLGSDSINEYLLIIRGTQINKFTIKENKDNIITLINGSSFTYTREYVPVI